MTVNYNKFPVVTSKLEPLPLFGLLFNDSSSISTGLFAFDNIVVLAVVLESTRGKPRGWGKCNLRSDVPYIFCRGAKVRLIQLLEYLSVASPESGLFSDWSRNKKVLRTEP